MEQPTPRPVPAYPGPMTDKSIRAIFREAGDFIVRELRCEDFTLYAYAIDGLVSIGIYLQAYYGASVRGNHGGAVSTGSPWSGVQFRGG